jgi:methylmalonyl-CoA mutase
VPVDDAPLALAAEFPTVTEQRWRASVDAVLTRGKDVPPERLERLFEKVLTTRTDDGIVLRPLYTASPAGTDSLPGQSPFVRSGRPQGPLPNGWDVRARVSGHDPDPAVTVLAELRNGATSVWLDLPDEAVDVDGLDAMLAGVHLEMVPLVLSGADPVAAADALRALWERRGLTLAEVAGCLGFDPLGAAARSGSVAGVPDGLAAAAEAARRVAGSDVRVLVVDATVYHDAGASQADEVALALATGVEYVAALTAAGLEVDEAFRAVEFRLAATDVQFPTMATLRASRRAWARVAQVWGASEPVGAQRQHAVTSRAMLTRHDVWVNLLRTTVACFAAGLGGADAVTVLPHDARLKTDHGPDDLARRLARNVSAILVEESHLARVVDPAGGSWFVEHLTEALAHRAWERFQQLQAAGGMTAAIDAGLVRSWLEDARRQREARVARRVAPITGVSEFPLLDEQVPPPVDEPASAPGADGPGLRLHPYAEPFEHLRDRAAALGSPTVFLATLGPLAEHTARASFCTNLFAAGGVRAVDAGTVTAQDVAAAFAASGARLACVVGSNERYASEAVEVARALAAQAPARLYLAGDPGGLSDDLGAAGVQGYVVLGEDAVALLDDALAALEGTR